MEIMLSVFLIIATCLFVAKSILEIVTIVFAILTILTFKAIFLKMMFISICLILIIMIVVYAMDVFVEVFYDEDEEE
jgi:hypothetical protein